MRGGATSIRAAWMGCQAARTACGSSCRVALKKEYCCNGCVVEDEEAGKVLQLQGDQRKNVSTFVVENKLAKKDNIKIHGF